MSERENLERDIWYTGSKDPKVIADYLIKQGWTKRPRLVNSITHQANALEKIYQDSLAHQVKGTVRRKNAN